MDTHGLASTARLQCACSVIIPFVPAWEPRLTLYQLTGAHRRRRVAGCRVLRHAVERRAATSALDRLASPAEPA